MATCGKTAAEDPKQRTCRNRSMEALMTGYSLPEAVTFWFNAILTSAAVASAWVNLILNFDKLV